MSGSPRRPVSPLPHCPVCCGSLRPASLLGLVNTSPRPLSGRSLASTPSIEVGPIFAKSSPAGILCWLTGLPAWFCDSPFVFFAITDLLSEGSRQGMCRGGLPDAVKRVERANKELAVGDCGGGANLFSQRVVGKQVELGPGLKNERFAIIGSEVEAALGTHGRGAVMRPQPVFPLHFAGLGFP